MKDIRIKLNKYSITLLLAKFVHFCKLCMYVMRIEMYIIFALYK